MVIDEHKGRWKDPLWLTLYRRFAKAKQRNKLPPNVNLVAWTNRWYSVFYPSKDDKPLSEDAQKFRVTPDGRVYTSGDYDVYQYLKRLTKDDDTEQDYYEYVQDVPEGHESDRRYRHPRVRLVRRKAKKRDSLPSAANGKSRVHDIS